MPDQRVNRYLRLPLPAHWDMIAITATYVPMCCCTNSPRRITPAATTALVTMDSAPNQPTSLPGNASKASFWAPETPAVKRCPNPSNASR